MSGQRIITMPKLMKTICEVFDKIAQSLDCKVLGKLIDYPFIGITSDSREVQPGFAFVAVKGLTYDGHDFISDALSRGAKGLIVSLEYSEIYREVPIIKCKDTREALVLGLKELYGRIPKRIIGVTGTNGKTTVTHLLWEILTKSKEKAGLIGTLGYMFEDGFYKNLPITTPNAELLWKILSQMKEHEIETVAMEVSSHGLSQKRVWGVPFEVAIFTNLSQDHLDYHGDMESYLDAKCILFRNLPKSSLSIINADDEVYDVVAQCVPGDIWTFGIHNSSADVIAEQIDTGISGSRFTVKSPWGKFDIMTELIGEFNIYNILASMTTSLALEYEAEIIIKAIEEFKAMKGRVQLVDLGQAFGVVIDYAHTPEALRNLLVSMRSITKGRVIVIFGAGGDRDKMKRPVMGRIATQFSDFAVITSDNPRSENPENIIEMIEKGVVEDNWISITNRKEAINWAIKKARPGDMIVIAGKGHEDYQILRDRTIHFDDYEIAKLAIEEFS